MRGRTLIFLTTAVVAVLFTAGFADDRADDSETYQTLTLEPGDSFVGWVAEPKPVKDLFDEFPQIELIYTWDAAEQRYRYAHREVEPGSRPLELVTAKTPVTIQIGDKPTSAQELFDAQPNIQLIYRWNESGGYWAIAWPDLPRDQWTLDLLDPRTSATVLIGDEVTTRELFETLPQIDVLSRYDEGLGRQYSVRGLAPAVGNLTTLTPGMSAVFRVSGEEALKWQRSIAPAKGLVKLRNGENWVSWAGPNDWTIADIAKGIGNSLSEARMDDLVYDPTRPETADEWPPVRRGDALYVTVNRDVNWLQPTGILPKIESAESERRRVSMQRALERVVKFFRDSYGIEADPWNYQIHMNDAYTASLGRPASVTPGGGINWAPRAAVSEVVLAHEYFHVLQDQLALGDGVTSSVAGWMVEGSAEYAAALYAISRGQKSRKAFRAELRRRIPSSAPTLRSRETGVYDEWSYSLGLRAIGLLVERAGPNAYLEFWRQIDKESSIGAYSRWQAATPWREAFGNTFGVDVNEFYAEFELPPNRSASSRRSVGYELRGRVVTEGGDGLAGFSVSAYLASGAGKVSFATTLSDGSFSILVPVKGDYRVNVELADQCGLVYTGTGASLDSRDSLAVSVAGETQLEAEMAVPENVCLSGISGRLVDATGAGIYPAYISAWGNGVGGAAYTKPDGTFSLTTGTEGRFLLGVYWVRAKCWIYYTPDGAIGPSAATRDEATSLVVEDVDLVGIVFRLPEDPSSLCD